ncbi:MAG: hypothetical protein K0S51_708 [Bacillales bacterium]|jgi:YlmC/YmxH family sporulation protein|nr:hypothetical protein [Bacillales bacterium]
MRLSELSGKEIVDLKRAERLGILGHTDLEIDEQNGFVLALIIPTSKRIPFFSQSKEIKVPWSSIKKIGSDMLIIDVDDFE